MNKALPLLGNEPFLIHNSDSVWIEGVGSNLERLFASLGSATRWTASCCSHLGRRASAMRARAILPWIRTAASSGRGERQMVPFVFTGVSIAHPRMFAGAPQGPFSINQLWDTAIDNGRLFGIRLDGLWMHVGTPEALIEAERWIESEDVA